MSAHPITGRATVTIKGQKRILAFDANCAAALFESVGPEFQYWVAMRFIGEAIPGQDARRVDRLTPADTVTMLHGLLATDREDSGIEESVRSLRREIAAAELAVLELEIIRVVLPGYGVPGEFVEAVLKAASEPRTSAASGTGTRRSRSR